MIDADSVEAFYATVRIAAHGLQRIPDGWPAFAASLGYDPGKGTRSITSALTACTTAGLVADHLLAMVKAGYEVRRLIHKVKAFRPQMKLSPSEWTRNLRLFETRLLTRSGVSF